MFCFQESKMINLLLVERATFFVSCSIASRYTAYAAMCTCQNCSKTGPVPRFNIKTVFPGKGIPMLKIRRSWVRLIFSMGIPILVRRHLYIIETGPCSRIGAHSIIIFISTKSTTASLNVSGNTMTKFGIDLIVGFQDICVSDEQNAYIDILISTHVVLILNCALALAIHIFAGFMLVLWQKGNAYNPERN